ncbi:rhodanese-like domain-containing protein [Alteromonas sp. ASW11-36]|uniref:Rhodanese-like domain-containing protein n=1 Tax=Alteromonas arenosi TaxID=3055817 RepID=A0ABT7ST04_9ALTE|nr:rhodanese-like domain-containing protein [Alteromonas sp. ASW11-36]MDM7859305.1 rhodanese-like domain-containing protein [Alteromonas sp. ASW11-36]
MKLLNGRELVGLVKHEIKQCACDDVARELAENPEAIVIDIRETEEVTLGMIAGAVHIPRGVLEMEITDHKSVKHSDNPLQTLASKSIYLYCRSGARSALAAKSLNAMGLSQVWSMAGGFNLWVEQKRSVVSKQQAKLWEVDGLYAWEQGGGI